MQASALYLGSKQQGNAMIAGSMSLYYGLNGVFSMLYMGAGRERPEMLPEGESKGSPKDPKIPSGETCIAVRTVGKDEQSVVYRVIRADENPAEGLVAKNPERGMTVEGHVISGSRNKGSQFISTTTDINVAEKWATKDGCRIVEINLNELSSDAKVYDLSTDTGRSTYLKGATAKGLAKGSSEVLIEGNIPASAIKVIE